MNLQQHPDFYVFLFEMWCASSRSKKIRNELEICVEKVVSAVEKLLEDGGENGITKFNPEESKDKFWLQIRSMMLSVLKKKTFT